jgi:hypothetical protein
VTREPTTAIVITRDRLEYTKRCLAALVVTPGIGDIHLVDHSSTWEPMIAFLGKVAGRRLLSEGERRIHVHWLPNAHPRALWTNGTLEGIVGGQHHDYDRRFLVTDCDVVAPTTAFGMRWLSHLHLLLDRVPGLVKAGLQLNLDIPEHNPDRDTILEWERSYRTPSCLARIPGDVAFGEPGWFYRASVDTTLALYRGLERYALDPAARTSLPEYEAVHLPWLENPEALSDELRHYYGRAEHGHWRNPDGFVDEVGL